jgi:hypothetical protein
MSTSLVSASSKVVKTRTVVYGCSNEEEDDSQALKDE